MSLIQNNMEFVDDYVHPPNSGLLYFYQNVPTREAEKQYEYNIEGCKCQSECKIKMCPCISRSGTSYLYEEAKDIQEYIIKEHNVTKPTYECNSNCDCKHIFCGNRLVQYGPRKNLKIKQCDNELKGLGLFTSKTIKKGNFICEYAGEIITDIEAIQRFKQYKEEGKGVNYIFCIKETFGDKTKKTFIDPTKYGNIGRYINHSCDPNCNLFVIRTDSTIPILGIFANRDITENSEITYDYGENSVNFDLPKPQLKKCLCDNDRCRKYLPFDSSLA